jgi:predicted O-methyltransferase YrrM
MPPQNPILRTLHRAASACPPLLNAWRRLREFSKHDPLTTTLYRTLFDRGRLTLPERDPEDFSPAAGSVQLPALFPLFAGEDAPLADLLFLLNLARGRHARRILEIGTYRARTTYALHLNCPDALIVSYDIQVLDSEFRRRLAGQANVQLRHASFSADADALRREPPFDFIFVDGSHRFEHVLEDSRLALERVAPGGIVVWHDYRHNDFRTPDLRVPEALAVIRQTAPVHAVRGTTCAVHVKPAP